MKVRNRNVIQWASFLLAAVLGTVTGAVLSFTQWLVLGRKVRRARLWISVNMLARVFGIPTIFLGSDLAFKMSEIWLSMLIVGGAILTAGIVIGAIHGDS